MRDGHVHSPFCPHGTKDSFEMYIEKAIDLGYTSISFTEHAPLPSTFDDPTPEKDSGMNPTYLLDYLEELHRLRKHYEKQIEIEVGLEVDYIEGFEKETTDFLQTYGPYLTDSILSVHFLKVDHHHICMDFSEHSFAKLIKKVGNLEMLYQLYYRTISKAIRANLGSYKPKRLGHLTLIRKFQLQYPRPPMEDQLIMQTLKEVKNANMALDYNGAGWNKAQCKETYPSKDIARKAYQMGIPLIYGSDAHQSKDLKQGWGQLDTELLPLF
ncbi:histidinol-phosphatase HisJ [Bacillaceae bacterium S4-13-58]